MRTRYCGFLQENLKMVSCRIKKFMFSCLIHIKDINIHKTDLRTHSDRISLLFSNLHFQLRDHKTNLEHCQIVQH